MKTVKLTFNFDFPVFRQTPGISGIWGDYQFVIDPNLKECDFWVIYSEHQLTGEKCYCHRDNIIFLPAEAFHTSARYTRSFLKQFGKIITVQRQIKGDNVVYWQNANPWFIEKSYDELATMQMPEKSKLLSIVSSNKVFTEGHKLRLEFAQKLKAHFKDKIDLFGRGIRDFKTKWEVTAPYKFHLAVENDLCDDWVTEKFFDPLLTYTYPIYYGCPNLEEKYMPSASFTRINIQDYEGSVKIIEALIEDEDRYTGFLKNASMYRKKALDVHQLFPMLTGFLDQMNPHLPKSLCTVTFNHENNISVIKKIVHKLFT